MKVFGQKYQKDHPDLVLGLIMCGNLNTKPDKVPKIFASLMRYFHLVTPLQPTFTHTDHPSTIDYILYYDAKAISCTGHNVFDVGFSDHCLVKASFKDHRKPDYSRKEDLRPNMSRILKEGTILENEECFSIDFLNDHTACDPSIYSNYFQAFVSTFEETLEQRMVSLGLFAQRNPIRKSIKAPNLSNLFDENRRISKIPIARRTPEQKKKLEENLRTIKDNSDFLLWDFQNLRNSTYASDILFLVTEYITSIY